MSGRWWCPCSGGSISRRGRWRWSIGIISCSMRPLEIDDVCWIVWMLVWDLRNGKGFVCMEWKFWVFWMLVFLKIFRFGAYMCIIIWLGG
jgi:hypothetical protein